MKNDNINAVIASNTLARKFFEKLSQRLNNARATTVESVLAWASKEVPATRMEVVALFKAVEALGKARFIEGRRGKASRLEWTANALEFAKEALADVDADKHESPVRETSGKTALDAIQAYFSDEGIESKIAPGPGDDQYLVASIPFGPLWAQVTARCEKEGAGMFVSLPIFGLLVRESMEGELERVNKGLRYGSFFTNESDTGGGGNGGSAHIFALRRLPAGEFVDISTDWTGYLSDDNYAKVDFPAKGEWILLRKTLALTDAQRIAASFWIEVDGGVAAVSVNGHVLYNSAGYGALYPAGNPYRVNVSSVINRDGPNEIGIGGGNWINGQFLPAHLQVNSVKLLVVPKG